MLTQSSLVVRRRVAEWVSSTKKAKLSFSTFGLHGAHLARSPWHITKKCLKRELVTGVIRSVSLVCRSTRTRKNWKATSLRNSGLGLNTTGCAMVHALPTMSTVSKVSPTFYLWIPKVLLRSWVTPPQEILKRTSTLFLKVTNSLDKELSLPLKLLKKNQILRTLISPKLRSSRMTLKNGLKKSRIRPAPCSAHFWLWPPTWFTTPRMVP